MIYLNNTTEQFKHKSLPASPEKDAVEGSKDLKQTLGHNGIKNELTSKTNSLYGSCEGDINNGSGSRMSDEGSEDLEFDGLIYKDVSNSINTLSMLNVLRKNRQLCDLILQLDDDSQDIYCHQLILACNSKFFMEIFNNYEEENNKKSGKDQIFEADGNNGDQEKSSPKTPIMPKKQSLTDFVNKNHGANNRQILFCLSSYLRNFLSGSQHHYAKINSIINHNNHQYQKQHCHSSNHNIDMAQSAIHDDETVNHINQNLDHQALKICIDYMYTSKLKVPSHLLPHVYTLAYHLSIENVVQVCAEYLTRLLNVDNCLTIRSFALDENLIEASSECIEKNIEHILQLRPSSSLTSRGSISSSMSSLVGNNYSKLNGVGSNLNENNDSITKSSSALSSSLNLANKEFNQLPRIQIELVGLRSHKLKLPDGMDTLTTMCMNWLVEELSEDKQGKELSELYENVNMLYMNSDSSLYDCCYMDSTDPNFDDHIDDYQKHHNASNTLGPQSLLKNGQKKRKNKPPTITTPSPFSNNRLKTFTITDQELNNIGTATPIKVKVLHDNEVICTHQTSENNFITICTLSGNLVSLSVHLLNKKQFCNSTENEIFNNAEANEVQIEARNRVSSHKSDTLSEMSFNIESQLDQNNLTYKSPVITFNRSLSSNSTLESEKIPRMSIPRCSHGVIAYENRLYIIGGYDRGECLDLCEVYDPKTNTISTIEPMNNRRGRAAITFSETENSIYALGGSDGHMDLNSIEYYNMTKKNWVCKNFDFELAFSNLATTSSSNFIYLVGLKSDSKKILKHTSCLKYEPKINQFTRLSELNQGRSQGVLVSTQVNLTPEIKNSETNEVLFVFGGHDQIRCLNSCEIYNVATDKWTIIPSMHEAKRGCGAAVHDETNSIFIVGGTNGTQSLKSVEIYNILTQKWTRGPELNIARANVVIAFIGNNLFAVGGFDGKSFLRTIEYLNIKNLEAGWSLFHKQHDFNCE